MGIPRIWEEQISGTYSRRQRELVRLESIGIREGLCHDDFGPSDEVTHRRYVRRLTGIKAARGLPRLGVSEREAGGAVQLTSR